MQNALTNQISNSPISDKGVSKEQQKHVLVINRIEASDNYFLLNEDGTPYKKLTLQMSSGRASSARISPDKKYLTYNSYEAKESPGCMLKSPPDCPPNTYGLKIKNLSTGEESSIIKPSSDSASYTYWSSDSRYIAYSVGNKTFLYNPVSKDSTQIASFIVSDSVPPFPVFWLPDSSELYLSDGTNIYLYSLSSKQLQKITSGNIAQITYDKKYLVVSRQNDGLYLANNEGGVKKITDKHFGGILNNTHKLVYSQFIQARPGAQNPSPDDKFSLFLYDLDNNQETQILSGISVNYYLSVDGSKIAYQDYLAPEQGKLQLIDANSGAKTKFGAGNETGQIIDWQ
ncbi:hypothetical protein HYU93_05175 [Candidatus Daviesbacteria bacterium]|nr:hypothetical protein [Candidatus Daviesbacteria bacterium]